MLRFRSLPASSSLALTAASFGALACALSCSSSSPAPAPEDLSFPKDFQFGTAIAGFQVDMGCPSQKPDCTDPNSDWYTWVTRPEIIADTKVSVSGEPVTDGPGFYELYPQDLDRAAGELHGNALRLSIEWSRVFPKPTFGIDDPAAIAAAASPDALAYYHALFAALRAHGLRPFVTLNHYTLPSWMHDAYGCHVDLDHCTARGWLDHDRILHEIAKYAGFVAKEFGGEVDRWATLNEPLTAVVFAGYVFPSASRSNPPGVQLRFAEAKAALTTMIEAHARMYDAVKANDTVAAYADEPAASVGTVYNMEAVTPSDPTEPADVQAAADLSYLVNEVFLNGAIHGDLDANLDGTITHRDDLAGRMDFLGINYYARITAKAGVPPFPDLSPKLDVTITSLLAQDYAYPKGIYEVLTLAKKKWNVPMVISETGVDGAGALTQDAWLVETLTWVKRAMAEGAKVDGYFWWTLMDNYEWNHGMTVKLGMYAVDGHDPQKTRAARPVVATYGRIAKDGKIGSDLAAAYPAPR